MQNGRKEQKTSRTERIGPWLSQILGAVCRLCPTDAPDARCTGRWRFRPFPLRLTLLPTLGWIIFKPWFDLLCLPQALAWR